MTERVTYVEIDLKKCSLNYGESPCTAAVGTTGDRKCFNTLATCQDKLNFDTETVTVRYAKATANPPIGVDAIPNIQGITIRPAKLELGESIGIRASVTITFKDHRSPDTGPDGDKYLNDRDYNPYERGTYWGKFRARQPFTQGQDIRVIFGTSDQSIDQMETRHFIVDKVAGPDSSGTFTIVAKDALRLAEGKRAQAPRLSRGFLSADITDTDTSFTLNPIGIGDIDYPASGKAQIGGNEIVTFTRSGDTITLTGRGLNGTEQQEHDEEDRFQLCLEYTGQKATAIIADLLENYANVNTDFIPLSSWNAEDEAFIGRLYTAVIAEPTAVDSLINEILQQTASSIWWDDITRLIRFRVLRQSFSSSATYDDNLIRMGSFSSKDQPEKRVSQVWTYYGQLNPLEDLEDPKNYRSALATVDLASEDNFDGVQAIRRYFSRWIPAFARNAAERLNNLILSRYSTPPRMITYQLQRDRDLTRPELGGSYNVESWTIQDDTGAIVPVNTQAIQVRNSDGTHDVMAEEILFSETVAPDDPTTRQIFIDTDANNVNIRQLYDSQYPAPDSGTTVEVVIESGVIIGSSSASSYSLRTGLWPEGPTVNISNFGRVQGKGGSGGNGANAAKTGTLPNGAPGATGGDALLIEYNVNLDNASGAIWSGGGGGGGGGAGRQPFGSPTRYKLAAGGGGGGARGQTSSNGGLAGEGTLNEPLAINESLVEPQSGGFGTANTIGQGGSGGFAGRSDLAFAEGGDAGNGGGPGLSGQAGQSGQVSGNGQTSSGGAGGQPGRAIVQSGGTANIINTGDIRGAIV